MYRPENEPVLTDREQVSAHLYEAYGDFYARLRFIEDDDQSISMFYKANRVVNEASKTTTVPVFDTIDPLMVRDRMEDLRQLIEPVTAIEDAPKPVMSLLIPLAVANEDPAIVSTLLTQIQKSQRALGEPVEAIIWANARKQDSGSVDNYHEVRRIAEKFVDADLQVSTALQLVPKQVVSMSRVRSDYMEAFMSQAEEKGYDIDHPVLWLDADTTFLSKDCLKTVKEGLDQLDGKEQANYFVHPEIGHSVEWSLPDAAERDEATKALVYSEVLHRIVRRRSLADTTHPYRVSDPYPEESGFAFRLSNYMLLGGVNTADPVNESFYLTDEDPKRRVTWMISANPELAAARMLHNQSNRRSGLTPSASSEYSYGVQWLQDAKVVTSGRRMYREVRKHGAAALRHRYDAFEGSYELYSSGEATDPEQVAVLSPEDISQSTSADRKRLTDPRDAAVLHRLMKRLFS